jgi:tRNA/rRNA methyltransferase
MQFTCPDVILVRPQLSQNIGACARAMKNFGFYNLKVVNPIAEINVPDARAMSAGATDILENAEIFSSLREALTPYTHIFATSAKTRDMVQSYNTPESAGEEIALLAKSEAKVAIMFGPERTGLENEDLVNAQHIISIPTNPDFSSLNLAQSVLLVCYEIYTKQNDPKNVGIRLGDTNWSEGKEFQSFENFLEESLDKTYFWKESSKKKIMWRNIRNIFKRQNLTTQDLKTLRGILSRFLNHDNSK